MGLGLTLGEPPPLTYPSSREELLRQFQNHHPHVPCHNSHLSGGPQLRGILPPPLPGCTVSIIMLPCGSFLSPVHVLLPISPALQIRDLETYCWHRILLFTKHSAGRKEWSYCVPARSRRPLTNHFSPNEFTFQVQPEVLPTHSTTFAGIIWGAAGQGGPHTHK